MNIQNTIDQMIPRKALDLFNRMVSYGSIRIVMPDGQIHHIGQADQGPQAELIIEDLATIDMILQHGSIGLANAFIGKLWDTPDLMTCVQFFCANIALIDQLDDKIHPLIKYKQRYKAFIQRNRLGQSRQNIADHYCMSKWQIGEEPLTFYQRFLDPTMNYSSALFTESTMNLGAAQEAKMDRLCRLLELKKDDHVIEIGSGFGAMAIHMAKHYGCQVTTTTLSKVQFAHAEQRIKDEGLKDQITILCQDYRQLKGTFDKLVSIEMIEAVGHRYLKTYFKQCNHLLKDGGLMALQMISINDQQYQAYVQSMDFIRSHIFPGGSLVSMAHNLAITAKYTNLNLKNSLDIGASYDQTLALWDKTLRQQAPDLLKHCSAAVYRTWLVYFAYCRGGFQMGKISAHQWLLQKQLSSMT